METLLCPDAAPTLLGFFDFAVAPRLLFYAYVPAIAVSLLVGGFVLVKSRFSLPGRLLAAIAASFALWTLNIFVQWVAAPVVAVMLAWQLTALFEAGIYIFTVRFAYAFIDGRDISFGKKLWLSAVAWPVLAFLPTHLNISSFDLSFCEGTLGPLWAYLYVIEIVAVLWTLALGIRRYRKEGDASRKRQIAVLTTGVLLFLGLFTASNLVGELTQAYVINLAGPIGMALFMGFLAYMIVAFRAFNAKLIATNALVGGLCILIGSQLFFVQGIANYALVGATLVLALVFGVFLVRSVRREVAQREKLEALSGALQAANRKLTEVSTFKTQLLSLASHQIKAPLAAIKGYLAVMTEGGYGDIPAPLMKPLAAMQHSANGLVELVTSFLDLRRIDEGRMEYKLERTDLAALVRDAVEELRPLAAEKGLALETDGLAAPCFVQADAQKLKQVAQNLVDNAIKYTPSGSVTVALRREEGFASCAVSDTGLGMAPELLPRLFDEFTRDRRVEHAIRGTGLGLYIAKRMIEAHGGTIAAASDGEGKGSRFTFRIPLAS